MVVEWKDASQSVESPTHTQLVCSEGSHGVSNDVVSFQNNVVTDIIMLSNLCSAILSSVC